MSQLRLIVAAGARERLRWARRHLYSLLILSPLVLGMSYFTAAQAIGEAAHSRSAPQIVLWAALALAAGLVPLNLSRASAEVYHLRRPESVLDALPVGPATHLHVALLERLARTSLVALVALAARTLAGDASPLPGALSAVSLALSVTLTALCESLAALNWIHWGHTRERWPPLVASALILPATLIAGLLLACVVRSDALSPAVGWNQLASSGLALAAVIYIVLRLTHARWRASDIEYAKRLRPAERRSLFGVRAAERWFGRAAAAQLARDLQLTLRSFSSAVYVALALAALWILALAAVLAAGVLPATAAPPGWFEPTWLPEVMATKFAAVLACASMAALVPVLVAHQIPHLWLERAAGVEGEQLWEAKLWYARLVSLPAPVAAWGTAALAGDVPGFYLLPLLGECLWLWWLVSTLFGVLAYEIPDQPGLAMIVIGGVAAGVGWVVSLLWPIGLALYAFGLAQLTERGHARAAYHLSGEEE